MRAPISRRSVFIASALVCISLCAQADSTLELIMPQGTTLTAKSIDNDLSIARFSGRVSIAGLASAQWVEDSTAEGNDGSGKIIYQLELVLVPDKSDENKLPYFKGYKIRGINIQNYSSMIPLIFGKAKSKDILDKKTMLSKKHGAFVLEDYSVGVECDAPWATANIVSVNVSGELATTSDREFAGC